MSFTHLRRSATRLVPAALLLAGATAAHAQQPPIVHSSAIGLVADFAGTFHNSVIPPVASVSGAYPKQYAEHEKVAEFSRSVPLAAGAGVVPGLTVTAHGIASHARSIVSAGQNVAANADTATANVRLALVPFRNGAAIAGVPALKLTATKLRASEQFTRIGRQQATSAATTTTIGSLTISGPLVGNQTLTFSGIPEANAVLFQSPTVTITLNKQVPGLREVCDPDCRVVTTSIVAGVIDVEFTNATAFGAALTGDIVFGLVRGGEN